MKITARVRRRASSRGPNSKLAVVVWEGILRIELDGTVAVTYSSKADSRISETNLDLSASPVRTSS